MRFKDYLFENTIKSFDKHLLNEDYMRFLKKNPHLTPDQREKINKFYTGKGAQHAVKEFEKEIGWQSKRVQTMTWSDFVKVMKSSKAGQRELLQSTEIPGSKGKDYWPIRLKTKDYIANIPLNFKTAKFMNSCDYGTIHVNFCIGNNKFRDKFWNNHVIKEKKVPVYITDGKGKWVVTIKPGNKDYEVWDKLNNKDLAIKNKEPIPNFSIQKELLSGGLKKLYDELREKYLMHWISKAEIENAKYEIKDGVVIWKNGTWIDGVWEDGTWEDGTWKKGTWEDGTWLGGEWLGGTWLGGYDKKANYHPKGDSPDKWMYEWLKKAKTKDAVYESKDGVIVWKNGTWIYGTWEDGVWEKGTWEGGIWEKGTWKYGTWEWGIWKGGTWERGTWKGGTWEKGTWENGTWEWGTWEKGTWEKGTWKAGHFMLPSIWEKGTWEKGTWEGGIWKDGTWEKGTWKDGTWEKGTWKGGTWEKGTWKGGYDKDGNYHPEGDSPDKWNK